MSTKTKPNEQVIHIRKCHICGHINEATDSANIRCQCCGKHLAPFYFFDESSLDGLDEGAVYRSTLNGAVKIQPIWGISLYWAEG